ncbi:PilZ domain-containing protein [Leptolyngbya sp. 7M]|uniref:PilZ domain-containing protein n=1 Tax=Leptolyngbya sp. 7M TaxID=2812896 RepID=UPI001B8AFA62|nr:PilZ domain-containing protein [Leptolyngbya sp. 7M]QYO66238.1 PilZ domain-containing protein [Leptolyngbya sp. 7M]
MPRKHERKTVAVGTVLDSSAGRRESRISDLSLGGCYVESMTGFQPGEAVSFDLSDQSGGTVGFTGEVAYVLDGFGFGLRFTNLGPEQIAFLERALPEEQYHEQPSY